MSGQGTPAPLSPTAILARLVRVDGADSGLDADLVRGRALPTDLFRFDLAPQFMPPPLYADTQSIALFGV